MLSLHIWRCLKYGKLCFVQLQITVWCHFVFKLHKRTHLRFVPLYSSSKPQWHHTVLYDWTKHAFLCFNCFINTRWPIGHIAGRAIGNYRIWSTVNDFVPIVGLPTWGQDKKANTDKVKIMKCRLTHFSLSRRAVKCILSHPIPGFTPSVNNLRKQMFHWTNSLIN